MREWLKTARKAKGMTMKDVAEKLGISESYYSQIESGERMQKMDLPVASALSTAVGIPLYQIIEQERGS